MYKAYNSPWENASEEDKESFSSFWTDQESEEEQRECFVKDGSRGERIENESAVGKQETKDGKEWYLNVDTVNGGSGEKLEEYEYSEKEDKQCYMKEHEKDGTEKRPQEREDCFLCEDSESSSTGINSEKFSEENEEERECFVTENSTDKSSDSQSGSLDSSSEDNVKEVSEDEIEPSEYEDGRESEEEGDKSLVKVQGTESKLEEYSRKKEETESDVEIVMDMEQKSKLCTEVEDVSGEEKKDEEESDTNKYDEDKGTEKSLGSAMQKDEQKEYVVSKQSIEPDSDFLESDEEIEYFDSKADNDGINYILEMNEPKSENEGYQFLVNQDYIEKLVLKEDSMGEGLERTSDKKLIGPEFEKGIHFLNEYNIPSSIEQKRLVDNKYEKQSKKHCNEGQDQDNTASGMTELHVYSVDQDDKCVKREATDGTEWTDWSDMKPGEKNSFSAPEQICDYSVDQHENKPRKEEDDMYGEKESFEDYHGSVGSPTLSVLTSGYGTYRPESPKDDMEGMDYKDDYTLAGLEEDIEYPSAVYCEDDSSQPMYQHSAFLQSSEQPISSLSLRGSDCCPFNHCDANEGVAVQHKVSSIQEITENMHESPSVCKDQALHFAAKSVGFPAREQISGIHSHFLKEVNHSVASGSDSCEADSIYEDDHHSFNLKFSKSVTVAHRNEYGLLRQERRKMKKAVVHQRGLFSALVELNWPSTF